ncbi:probable receptor-like protein kinase At5g24010 [Asparagus officinalis]|uniref:probable receptor-like protein kinase At5g24010 n=1 Tax=Asparagus officinalis TaxID=4686 RepID=UPI00098E1D44|nr:probable receptor-like protein kinase At5g24010 [Asparagus officinalis]
MSTPNQLTLDLVPYSLAFVNAIEVFNAPPYLVDGDGCHLRNCGRRRWSSRPAVANKGLESLYRVNVGGSLVTPANDTLWRTWVTDDPYIFRSSVSFKNSTSASAIVYRSSDPRQTPEIAPQSVYDTARTMAIMEDMENSGNQFNVTWSFNVTPGETHFIRMHFCDFVSAQVTALYFNVYIGNLLAYADLQPSSFTDQTPAAAFYLDFAADSDESGLMNVSVGRSNRSTPQAANALLNGLEIMKLGLDSTTTNTHTNGVSIKILIPPIVFGVILVPILILAAVFLHKRRRKPKSAVRPKASPSASSSPFAPDFAGASTSESNFNSTSPRVNLDLQIPFEEIKFATDNFSDSLVIGTGGFGKVYKGVLRDGTKIAVKRGMPESKQGYPEFQTEIEVLSRIRHRHLVSLIGYCNDHSEMILVYEYMEKGPLKNYLYGSNNLPSLTWKQRLEICIGAARGLHYLHTGYSHNIIHRDIKSTNILLGGDYLAKVADFGLSRVGPSFGETHVSTGVKGTFGYLDPEYYKVQKLTDKSDVYSFGVMMFEVLCARPVIDPKLSREQLNLAEWAVLSQRRGRLEKIIDPKLVGEINENSLRKFGQTAEKCLANYGVDRPTIGDVLWNLEYALQLQMTELRREPFEDSGVVEAREEERERRIDFVPDVSEIKVERIEVDKETMEMLSSIGMGDFLGVEKHAEVIVKAPAYGGSGGFANGHRS